MQSPLRRMKAITNVITFLFFVLILREASAQQTEIRGKVTDTKSGEPMIGVHITLKEAVHGTVTGTDGSFILKTPIQTPLGIHVSYVGYVPLDIEVTNTSVA